MLASEEGELEVVKYLVESGADVEAKDRVSKNIRQTMILNHDICIR